MADPSFTKNRIRPSSHANDAKVYRNKGSSGAVKTSMPLLPTTRG